MRHGPRETEAGCLKGSEGTSQQPGRTRPFLGKHGLWAHGICRVHPFFLHVMAIDPLCTEWGGTARRSPGRGESPRADSQSRPTQGRPRGDTRTPAATCTSQGMRGGQTGSQSPNPRLISHCAPTRPPKRGGPTLPAAPRQGQAWLCGCAPPPVTTGLLPSASGLTGAPFTAATLLGPAPTHPGPPRRMLGPLLHGRCRERLRGAGH